MARLAFPLLVLGLVAALPYCQASFEPVDPTIADRTEARIHANEGWQRVLASVAPGDQIEIHASGNWTFSSWYSSVGPERIIGGPAGYARLKDRPFGSLLCGVDEGRLFNVAVGGSAQFTIPVGVSGSLDFVINDVDVQNNRGELAVTVIRRTPIFHTRDVIVPAQ